jgi:rhodanese-related sulfurtransferase
MTDPNILVLDTRSYDAFGSQHIPGSWHVDFGGNFPTFAGWVLPVDKDILLVTTDYDEALQATIWARRVGVDRIVGYLDGGMFAWAAAGYKTKDIHQVSAEELYEMATGSSKIVLLDVRAPKEYEDNHIEGALNIPAPDLRTRYKELDPEKSTVLICSTGHRSSLGASILRDHGFRDVYNVAGGMTGYGAAGHSKRCKICENPHGSRYFSDYLRVRPQWNIHK